MHKIVILIFLLGSLYNAYSDVIINEICAATSDRILQYSSDGVPTLGSGYSWYELEYDDAAWHTGQGGFGYGDSDDTTDVFVDMHGATPALYLRQTFLLSAENAVRTDVLQLSIDYDDGFIAYINGTEVARRNMGPPNSFAFHDQPAYNDREAGTVENISLATAADLLDEGTNVLAIQVHNKNAHDDTLSLIADLYITGSPQIHCVNHTNTWSYYIGVTEPSGGIVNPELSRTPPLHVKWGDPSFDDSNWSTGPGGIGYGDGDDATIVNIQNSAVSIYMRQAVYVDAATAARTDPLEISIDYDDGFVAYLNGYELTRRSMGNGGEFVPHNYQAYPDHEAGTPLLLTYANASRFLHEGTNVFAVQVHNHSFTSSDLTLIADMTMTGTTNLSLIDHAHLWRYLIGTNEPSALPDISKKPDDNFVDWIELYNNGSTSVSLNGWVLTDNASDLEKWIFPNVSIGPDEYLKVYCDGKNTTTSSVSAYLHTNFALSKEGEYLALLDNHSPRYFIDEISPRYPTQSFFHSYGWCEESNAFLYFLHATPGAKNTGQMYIGMLSPPVFDTPPGFFATTQNVAITLAEPNAEIRYTRDGSEPTESSSLYTSPLTFDETGVVRAKAFKHGWIPSRTVSRTFLIDERPIVRFYPIVSIVSDTQKSLFKPNGVTAIVGGAWNNDAWNALTPNDYNIPMQRGRPYERPASVTFLDYEKGTCKEIDCGIRIAGSEYTRERYILQNLSGVWNQHPHVNKPQFNLYFRSDYGEGTLDFPFITGSSVRKYDSVRIRSGKNDWINPFIHDEFFRRVFINMGNKGSKGYLAWLFVNGERKAFFNPCERLDERFMQESFDCTSQWDIINHGGISEGDDIALNDLLLFLKNKDMNDANNYTIAKQKIDIENYIDYLIVETYSANWDWPNNNWVAARERTPNSPFRFFVWDAETTCYNASQINTDSFNENPSYSTTGGTGLNGENVPVALIYQALKESSEFRLAFADRIQKHYFVDGVMTESNLIDEWMTLETPFSYMLSTFFGQSMDVRTRTQWIPHRRTYIFQQYVNEGLWPNTSAPYFNQHGGAISPGFTVAISHDNAIGTIYYTRDGTDPRNIGGTIHGTEYTTPFSLDSDTHIKARVYKNTTGEWSPLCDATFAITGSPPLVVTEMMYHPFGGEEYEFIELKNISENVLTISNYSFIDGITFSFAGSGIASVSTGEYVVLVRNIEAFTTLYDTNNIHIAGIYDGKLNNAGERIELQGAVDYSHLAYTYYDTWYPLTDGGGYSLVIANEYGHTNMWGIKEGWRESYETNGTPGRPDIPEPCIYLVLISACLMLLVGKRNVTCDV